LKPLAAPKTNNSSRVPLQMQTANFATILAGVPQPYLVLDCDSTIVGASDAYLSLTEREREDIVGRHILEAFPDNPEAVGTVEQGPLEVSLRHALSTGRPHEMAVIQYDIPGGGFVQKFWTPVHTPVIGEDGLVVYIIQNPMDVTERVLRNREADARLRVALHAADLATWEYEPETDIWRRSPMTAQMRGEFAEDASPDNYRTTMIFFPGDRQMTLRVLIVEDEMLLALDLEDMLIDAGHTVVGQASDMAQALSLAQALQGKIDLAIMDGNLAGGSNGLETAAALRERWDIPSLFVSGNLDERTRFRAQALHPVGFIGKPYSEREILSCLSRVAGVQPAGSRLDRHEVFVGRR